MPPKRKRQPSHDHPASTSGQETAIPPIERAKEPRPGFDPGLLDIWTDDQESCLLRAILRWKPEDSLTFDTVESNNTTEDSYRTFSLPEDQFGNMMFQKRLNPKGSESPPASATGNSVKNSAVADTEGVIHACVENRALTFQTEPGSSPTQESSRHDTRGTRAVTRGGRTLRRQAANDSSPPSTAAHPSAAEEASVDADGDTRMSEDGEEEESETHDEDGGAEDTTTGKGATRRGGRQASRGRAGRGKRGGSRRGARGR
ncbi:MAG: hypothetical protein Q9227_001562 [Pyrenula ochraceoflavens]